MIIGVPKEIKKEEYRVGMTPTGAAELSAAGHKVIVENGAGTGSGFSDEQYRSAGAILTPADELYRTAELVVKVKEPLPREFGRFRPGQALFTYLHLAPNRELTAYLMESGVTALAYETLEVGSTLPLLAPMSEIAGRMAPLVASWCLQRVVGGTGVLPSGSVGVRPARALILGAGNVGSNAARVAAGIGMETVVLNKGTERLQRLDELFRGQIRTVSMTSGTLRDELRDADIVVGGVLVPGGRAPLIITRTMLADMKPGAVIVDVAIDQGGCCETSRPTTHDSPVYTVDGIIHYAVANMPGAYPRTSTLALTNATLPYIRTLADRGVAEAIAESVPLAKAVNVRDGRIVHPVLAAVW